MTVTIYMGVNHSDHNSLRLPKRKHSCKIDTTNYEKKRYHSFSYHLHQYSNGDYHLRGFQHLFNLYRS